MTNDVSPARRLAYDLLQEVLYRGAFANIVLDKALFASSLDRKDRALATELLYGTVKFRDRLAYMIDQFSKTPVKKMDQKTASILLLSVYQLDQLSRIPDHAVVHEAVNIAKEEKLASQRLINAVLRSLIRNKDRMKWPDAQKQKALYLAKTESFPQWMIETWIKKFGYKSTKDICKYFNQASSVWLRANVLKNSTEELIDILSREGADVKKGNMLSESILYECGPALRDLSSFQEGRFAIQDQAAMLVAHAVNPQAGERILDMCAAPGGKTSHMAELMGNKGEILAVDLHAHRTNLIHANAKRLDLDIINTETRDASLPALDLVEVFDRVLLDAPCSGLGVLNRRPDARWQKQRKQIPKLVTLQSQLLDRAAEALKPGGRLVYSTCTLLDEENKDQVLAFLDRHPDFSLAMDIDKNWPTIKAPEGMIELRPDLNGCDGFFIAALVKGGRK